MMKGIPCPTQSRWMTTNWRLDSQRHIVEKKEDVEREIVGVEGWKCSYDVLFERKSN